VASDGFWLRLIAHLRKTLIARFLSRDRAGSGFRGTSAIPKR